MLPELYITIPTYALMATIGLCVVVMILFLNLEKMELTFNDLLIYLLAAAGFGFVFSRIMFVIAMLPSMEKISVKGLLDNLLGGGIVFYGGLFGVLVAIFVVSKVRGKDVKKVLDFVALTIPIFHAFARIGCLLAGCCYGKVWNWGIMLWGEEGVIRFPVQLFESIANIFIFILLYCYSRKRHTYKNCMWIYLCSYALCRFVLEFYRGDEIRGIWLGLSTAQWVSIIIAIGFICTLVGKAIVMRNKKVDVYEE